MKRITVSGGCHCGRVAFEVRVAEHIQVQQCNCSICSMVDFVHLIVPAEDFKLLRGKEFLTEYQFNSKVARHLFCKHCGIKSFYVPRSNPEGFSVNLKCIQLPAAVKVELQSFDGLNWEANAESLQHLSKPALPTRTDRE